MKKIIVLSLASFIFISSTFAASGMVNIPQKIKDDATVTLPVTQPIKKPIKGLIILGDNYAVDEDFVYVVNAAHTNWIKMPDADRVTFKVL